VPGDAGSRSSALRALLPQDLDRELSLPLRVAGRAHHQLGGIEPGNQALDLWQRDLDARERLAEMVLVGIRQPVMVWWPEAAACQKMRSAQPRPTSPSVPSSLVRP